MVPDSLYRLLVSNRQAGSLACWGWHGTQRCESRVSSPATRCSPFVGIVLAIRHKSRSQRFVHAGASSCCRHARVATHGGWDKGYLLPEHVCTQRFVCFCPQWSESPWATWPQERRACRNLPSETTRCSTHPSFVPKAARVYSHSLFKQPLKPMILSIFWFPSKDPATNWD